MRTRRENDDLQAGLIIGLLGGLVVTMALLVTLVLP